MCKETFRLINCLPAGQYVPNFIWNDTERDGGYRPINIPFTGVEGLREEMTLDVEPIEYFSKYFTEKLLTLVKRQTESKSIVHDWKPTNRNEIKEFLGLCILMGIVPSLEYQCFGLQIHFMTPLSLSRL